MYLSMFLSLLNRTINKMLNTVMYKKEKWNNGVNITHISLDLSFSIKNGSRPKVKTCAAVHILTADIFHIGQTKNNKAMAIIAILEYELERLSKMYQTFLE